MNRNKGCHEDYLHKKEAKGKWNVYWVILNGKFLLFYESKNSQKLSGSIQIGSNTKCTVAKRKTYSFPFAVRAEHGCYLFKCETSVQRHQWMTSIQEASQLLASITSPIVTQTDQTPETSSLDQAVEETLSSEVSLNDDLPSNVLIVTPCQVTPESPTLPRVQDRKDFTKVKVVGEKPINGSQKRAVNVYPFTRQSEKVSQTITNSEREQIKALNLSSHFSHNDFSSVWATECSVPPRHRSLPSTPEKDSYFRSMRQQTLNVSALGKTKSLDSYTSSDSMSPLLATNMRFSRHMVSGNDIMDSEV